MKIYQIELSMMSFCTCCLLYSFSLRLKQARLHAIYLKFALFIALALYVKHSYVCECKREYMHKLADIHIGMKNKNLKF